MELKLPEKGFTKAERAWIASELAKAFQTINAVSGRNTTIDNSDEGQTVNASDCDKCP